MSTQPQLTSEQKSAVLAAAAEVLAATVQGRPPRIVDETLSGAANLSVLGCFVTARRAGMLRGCCGFMGSNSESLILQAITQAARRTPVADPRFPPVSPSELSYLDLDVWLLFDLEPVAQRGEARRKAVAIGRHGLQVARGEQRGLLLPGVAVDHALDAEAFLQHVCIKAGLPPHAWKEDDVQLFTFEGVSIEGHMPADAAANIAPPVAKFTPADVQIFAQLCRKNILAQLEGGTPSPYAFNAADGQARGLVVSIRDAQGTNATRLKFAVREGLPVQSTLYGLCGKLARSLANQHPRRESWGSLAIDVAVLDDVALHGTPEQFDERGLDPATRAILVTGRGKSGFALDPALSARELLEQAISAAHLRASEPAHVYSAAVVTTAERLTAGHHPQALDSQAVREPAVAGTFYPSDPAKLNQLVDQLLASPSTPTRSVSEGTDTKSYPAVLVPHAGLKYSGQIAANVFRGTEIPSTVIVIGPKHTRHGVEWAIAPNEAWSIPGSTIAGDPQLAQELVASIPGLELDAAAHAQEHAIEVELPFLARLAPQAKVLGIVIGSGDYDDCRRFAQGLANVLRSRSERTLLVISSDMNHFASDAENRRLDEMALACIERLDSEGLLTICRKHHISMCGVLPAVIVMETLRELDQLHRAERIGYATSGDVTGDKSRVVGYAGVVFE